MLRMVIMVVIICSMPAEAGATIFLLLGYQGAMGNDMVNCMERMGNQWLKFWMRQLGGFDAVDVICKDCESALAKGRNMVSLLHPCINNTYKFKGFIYTVEGD